MKARFYRKTSVLLIALVLVCSLLPLGAVTYASTTNAEAAVEHEVQNQLRAEVEGISERTETNADASAEQARMLASQNSVLELTDLRQESGDVSGTAAYERAFEYTKLISQQDSVVRSVIYWEDGDALVGAHDGDPVDDNRGEMLWFEKTMSPNAVEHGDVRASYLSMSRAVGEPVIRYTSPVERDGERVGVALISYRAGEIVEPINQLEVGENGYGAMIAPDYTTAEGTELGSLFVANGAYPNTTFDEEQAGELYIPDEQLSGDTGSVTFRKDGKTWHAEYQRTQIGGKEYYTLATIPESEVLAPALAIRNRGLLIGGVAGLLIVIVSVVATRRFTAPINRLAEDAQAVADGDMDREIRQSTLTTELNLLTESTQSMKENVVEALDDAQAQREKAQEQQEKAETAKRDADAARHEAEQLSDHLQQKAQAFSQTMDRAAEGDLTQRMDADGQSEAMADIARAFNGMMSDIEATMERIHSFADDVATSVEEVTASTEESETASEQVSASVQEISADTEEQSTSLQQVASEMQNLSGSIEEVAASADEIATQSEQTAELGRDGRDSAGEAMEEMQAIEAKSEETSEEIETLAAEISEIGDIVELIQDIADQTNLLALNASIEAARAGEAGEGFAVVADEIKQLAAEVGNATTEVETLIEDIHASADTAVTDIQEMSERVTTGTATIEASLDALEEIAASVEEVNDSVQDVRIATDDQASSTEEVASMIDEVADSAEQVNGESATVSAAAEEQTASLSEIAGSAQTLAEQTDELQDLLDQFEIGSEDTTQ
ncbi:methyl-accepting chemotaxis protein [Halanaeroarchaeum sulfurireducens]|nr:methyl-accepting chemotaxis protein [Halanaeroarchaeum sulfurireducens]